jgi:hypothetical protein
MATILEGTIETGTECYFMKDSLDPVMRNIEAFLEDTQKTVNGIVTVLKPHFTLTESNLRMI